MVQGRPRGRMVEGDYVLHRDTSGLSDLFLVLCWVDVGDGHDEVRYTPVKAKEMPLVKLGE